MPPGLTRMTLLLFRFCVTNDPDIFGKEYRQTQHIQEGYRQAIQSPEWALHGDSGFRKQVNQEDCYGSSSITSDSSQPGR